MPPLVFGFIMTEISIIVSSVTKLISYLGTDFVFFDMTFLNMQGLLLFVTFIKKIK